MRKIIIFLFGLTLSSLFNSLVLLILGVTLICSPDLVEMSPAYLKKSIIASFVTSGIHLLVFGSSGSYLYLLNKKSQPKINT